MNTQIQQLHNAIEQNTDQLLACLIKELEVLNTHNYNDLVDIANEKQTLVQMLDDLDKNRQALSPAENYNQYLQQMDNSGRLLNEWKQLLDKIKQCNQQNEINGRLINRMNQISRETLDLITGHNSNSDVTYSPEGLKQGINTRITDTRA